jgi:hypothetical protein
LTQGCQYDLDKFIQRFDDIFPRQSDTYKIIVIVDTKLNKIIGSGSLILEKKFVRDTGIVSS